MLPVRRVLAGLLLLTETGAGQTGVRTEPNIPEPTRTQLPPLEDRQAFTVGVVKYSHAIRGRDFLPHAVPELIEYFEQATEVEVPVDWNHLRLDSDRITQAALLYMVGNDAVLQIGEPARRNLGRYLRAGGLLYAEDIRQRSGDGMAGAGVAGTPFDRQFKALMRDPLVLGNRGKHWQKMKPEHPLFRSYFSFPDGPPLGGARGGNVDDLEMLEVRGRTAVIFSDLNISWFWADTEADGRNRGLQFGCNLIVYAVARRAALGAGDRTGNR